MYNLMVIRLIRRWFGRYVDDTEGYSVRIRYDGFPGMNIRYAQGARTMNVFAEIMANGKELHVYLMTFGWERPYESEPLDDADRTLVRNRIVSALDYLGYAVRLWDPQARRWKPPAKADRV